MEKKLTPEIMEKLKNATTSAEITRILSLGNDDVQKLSLDDLDGVSGGGHYVKERVNEMLQAPSCCAEAKAAGQAWLDALGTEQEAEKTKELIAEL